MFNISNSNLSLSDPHGVSTPGKPPTTIAKPPVPGPVGKKSSMTTDSIMDSTITYEDLVRKIKTRDDWMDFLNVNGKIPILILDYWVPNDDAYNRYFFYDWLRGKRKVLIFLNN